MTYHVSRPILWYPSTNRGAPLHDSGLQASKLSTLATCLCGAPAYFEKYAIPTHPSELADHQWVNYKLTSNTLKLTKGNRVYNIKMNGTITTNNAAARTAFVEGGHGLARITLYDATPKIRKGSLISVLDEYTFSDIELYGVFPPDNAESKKLRLLLDFLTHYFNQLPLISN